jgi:hypothetical protein
MRMAVSRRPCRSAFQAEWPELVDCRLAAHVAKFRLSAFDEISRIGLPERGRMVDSAPAGFGNAP